MKKPTIEEIAAYCKERCNTIDPERFFAYYEMCGWCVGKNKPMKNWQMAVVLWEKNNKDREKEKVEQDRKSSFQPKLFKPTQIKKTDNDTGKKGIKMIKDAMFKKI